MQLQLGATRVMQRRRGSSGFAMLFMKAWARALASNVSCLDMLCNHTVEALISHLFSAISVTVELNGCMEMRTCIGQHIVHIFQPVES
jgi:hypothetical protein